MNCEWIKKGETEHCLVKSNESLPPLVIVKILKAPQKQFFICIRCSQTLKMVASKTVFDNPKAEAKKLLANYFESIVDSIDE